MAAMGTQQENLNLRGATLWTPRDDQRCGVLIMGSRRADIFVATDALILAETLGAEEVIRTWLAERGIHMAPKETIPTRQSGRDGLEVIRSDPAEAGHDSGKDKG
ncbi:MAG: hypothetical protein ACREMB_09000 [Candidatus Rokuibacteriota bacterium]